MKRVTFMAIIGFAAGCVGSVMLWWFWTPRCNESCPEWVVLSIFVFVAFLPLMTAVVGAVIAAKRYETRTKVVLATIFIAFAVTSFALLTESTRQLIGSQ
jgi:hypothetical protein